MDVGLYGDLSARFSKVDKEDVPDQREAMEFSYGRRPKEHLIELKHHRDARGRGSERRVRVGRRLLLQFGAPGWKRGINQNKLRNAKREDGAKQGVTIGVGRRPSLLSSSSES